MSDGQGESAAQVRRGFAAVVGEVERRGVKLGVLGRMGEMGMGDTGLQFPHVGVQMKEEKAEIKEEKMEVSGVEMGVRRAG